LKQHYQVWEKDSYIVVGGNDDVVVEVACAPESGRATTVIVSAFSADSATAEAARNSVREYIEHVMTFE
jgi:hypothetical protein